MGKKYIIISLDDERSKVMASVLGNKTCKKIIDLLINKDEISEKEIADSLKLPINTIEYNLKKLLNAEIIEKTKNFFWSKKGKKITLYKLSNKSILISPKSSNINSKIKSLALLAGASGILALLIRQLTNVARNQEVLSAGQKMIESVSYEAQTTAIQGNFLLTIPAWGWFLIGTVIALFILSIINWRKL